MPSYDSEAIVLRTYPYRDADLIVSFFTRDRGKLRGVARGVRRPKNDFGAALERLAHSRLFYRRKEGVELSTLQRGELLGPANLWKASYAGGVALDLIAEAADQLLPDGEALDAQFRLMRLVVGECCRGVADGDAGDAVPPWAERSLAYFLLWSARLGGWLPPLDRCIETDRPFAEGEPAYFSPHSDGLCCAQAMEAGAWRLPAESRALAASMLAKSLDAVESSQCAGGAVLELQRFLLQRTQAQVETRLRGADALRGLWGDRGPQAPAGEA